MRNFTNHIRVVSDGTALGLYEVKPITNDEKLGMNIRKILSNFCSTRAEDIVTPLLIALLNTILYKGDVGLWFTSAASGFSYCLPIGYYF